ncbi:hypothetical protein BDV06DRAFT_93870 [Aspergillus oleicola]
MPGPGELVWVGPTPRILFYALGCEDLRSIRADPVLTRPAQRVGWLRKLYWCRPLRLDLARDGPIILDLTLTLNTSAAQKASTARSSTAMTRTSLMAVGQSSMARTMVLFMHLVDWGSCMGLGISLMCFITVVLEIAFTKKHMTVVARLRYQDLSASSLLSY